MTLDKAIINEAAIITAKQNNARMIRERMKSDIALKEADELEKSAKEHNQLREWLCELKNYREAFEELRKDAEKNNREVAHIRQCSKIAGFYEAIGQLKEWTRQQSFSNIPKEALLIKLQEMEKGHG